jgi:hypothetical protein
MFPLVKGGDGGIVDYFFEGGEGVCFREHPLF